MEIITDIMDFFGIEMLSQSSTFVDILSFIIMFAFAIFIITYIVKLVFTVLSLPERNIL